MSDPEFDPKLRAALDRFTVPPLSEGFADRVTAAALARSQPQSAQPQSAQPQSAQPQPAPPPQSRAFWRDRRGGWTRTTKLGIGAIALGAMTAAAAATGMLGDFARSVPVIGPVIASIAPAPKAKPPKPKPAPQPERQAASHKAAVDDAGGALAPVPPPVLPATPREQVRERIAQRIVHRIEQREARREAMGLPPRPAPTAEEIRQRIARLPPAKRAALIKRIRRLPPEDRAAILERVREIRGERAGAASIPAAPQADDPAAAAPVGEATAPMTAEERAALREMMREGRERRRERWKAHRQGL